MKKLKLHWQILIAILLAIPFGLLFGEKTQSILGWEIVPFFNAIEVYSFIGKLFINALKMLIIPLIASAIITGIANLGKEQGLANLGFKTVIYYSFSSFLAILVGLFLVNLFTPGLVDGAPAKEVLNLNSISDSLKERISNKGGGDVVEVFLRMVPANIVGAAAEGKMLGIITFSLIFGFFMARIPNALATAQLNFWNGVYEVMMKMTNLIMKFAPLGVFGLIAKTVGTTGFEAIKPLAVFFFTVLLALIVHAFIVLPLLLMFIGRVKPRLHYKAMAPALLTAFSTSSSSATLPQTIDCVQNRAGVSKRVSSITLPLGSTVNMDGTALYECVAAMFIAQAYGIEITLITQFTIVLIALLTSIGVAGIPSASLVAIVIILGSIGLPAEGIGLILAVDRILDMCRTAVNVFSDSCAAVIISKLEGETPLSED